MRQRPQDLSGPLTTTPQANLVDTFAPKDLSLAGKAPVQQELLDFSTLSNAAKKLIDQRTEFNQVEGERAGLKVGSMLEQGATDAEAYAAIVESGDTPRTIASKFAKAAKDGKIDAVDIPGFKVGLAKAKGAFVAGQMKSTAEELIPKYAAMHSQLPPGDDAAEDALIREAFSEMRGANQEDLDKLDFFGNREAEPMLQDLALKFLDKVRGESRSLQMQQRKDFVGIEVSNLATSYMGKDTSDAEQATIISKIGAMEPELRLEGIDGKALIAEKVIAAAGSLSLTEGWGKAAEFLEKVHLTARAPAGDNQQGAFVFRDNPNMDLLQAISQAELRMEREQETKSQRTGAIIKDTEATMLGSEGYAALDAAIQDTRPDAVRTAFEVVRQAITDRDPDTMEQFGLTEENVQYALPILRRQEEDTMLSSRKYREGLYEEQREFISSIAATEGYKAAMAAIPNTGLGLTHQRALKDEVQALEAKNLNGGFDKLRGTGIFAEMDAVVQEMLPEDDYFKGTTRLEWEARVMQEFSQRDWSIDADPKGIAPKMFAIEMLKGMRQEIQGAKDEQKLAQDALNSADGDAEKARKKFEMADTYATERTRMLAGESKTVVGGYLRDEAPKWATEFEEFLIKTKPTKIFQTAKDVKIARSRIESLLGDSSVPKEDRDAVITDAFARLGVLSLTDLYVGNMENIRKSINNQVTELTRDKLKITGRRDTMPRYDWDLSTWNTVDFTKTVPIGIAFKDMKNAGDYLAPVPGNPDLTVLNPLKPLDDNMLAMLEFYLDETGQVVSEDAIITLLIQQRELWK